MAVPTGGEIAIYNDPEKSVEYRIGVGLDYPALTAQKQDLFGAALDPADWWFTQTAGAPDVSGGSLNLELFGGALRQQVTTRPHWFPSDNRAFQISFGVQFPQDDPVYSPSVTVGSLEAALAGDEEPFRVHSLGSAVLDSLEVGSIQHAYDGNFPTELANDKAFHTYVVEWDPDGVNPLRITRDGGEIYAGSGYRPYFVSFGFIWPTRDITALNPAPDMGAPLSPKVVMRVSELTISSFGDGYESRSYPGWTSANAGGTIDTAVDGERFLLDGETWAKIPKANIKKAEVRSGRSLDSAFDRLTLDLVGPDPDAPDTTKNIFAGDRFVNRPIWVDTRVSNGTATAWKRKFMGIITKAEWEGPMVKIEARDRPMHRLDTFLSKGYTSLAAVPEVQEGEFEGVELNFTIDQILEDLIDVSDAVAGGILGATSTLIQQINFQPKSIGTGGQSLMSTIVQWCDRLAHECWRKYRVTGNERYGQLVINLWTYTGTIGYIFRGKGASGGNTNLIGPLRIIEDVLAMPGQAYYRDDNPSVDEVALNQEHFPILGIYPFTPYPPNSRVLSDSFGPLQGFGLSTLQTFKDKDGNNVTGGVAKARLKLEASRARIAEFRVHAHDWPEPADIIAIDDPDWTGETSTDVWIIDNVTTVLEGATMTATIQCMDGNFLKAIQRVL